MSAWLPFKPNMRANIFAKQIKESEKKLAIFELIFHRLENQYLTCRTLGRLREP